MDPSRKYKKAPQSLNSYLEIRARWATMISDSQNGCMHRENKSFKLSTGEKLYLNKLMAHTVLQSIYLNMFILCLNV